jgi:hypothetical protein
MKKTYLTVTAVVLFFMGFIFTLDPNRYIAGFGISITNASLLNVVRSFGGFYLGFAIFLAFARNQENLINGAVTAVMLAMGGFLAGRIISLILEGLPDPKIWVSAVIELVLLVWGLILQRRSTYSILEGQKK